jgi:phosphatidylserine synthase
MRLRQVLLQETIRSIALGYVVFLLLGVVYTSLGLSAGQVLTLSGLVTVAIFLTFTAIRLKTGRELMARTRREWTIVGVVGAVVLAGFIAVAAVVGEAPGVLGLRPLSVLVAVLVLILFSWLGYRAAAHR